MKYMSYREDKKHGTFDFPIEFYHVGPTHPRYEMSYHWHIEYEIIRILKGRFLMTISEEEFLAKEGDIIFVKGGLLHGGIPKNCGLADDLQPCRRTAPQKDPKRLHTDPQPLFFLRLRTRPYHGPHVRADETAGRRT